LGWWSICGEGTIGVWVARCVTAYLGRVRPSTTSAGLQALVVIFDVAGTILSGWLVDRFDPRYLLVGYYTLRGMSLLILPSLLQPHVEPSLWVFVIFYGLDWIATVPPTVALCRERFGMNGPIVFGWVFASHQVGAAIAAYGAGAIRDVNGSYDLAWYVAGGLCAFAALMSGRIRRHVTRPPAGSPPPEPSLQRVHRS